MHSETFLTETEQFNLNSGNTVKSYKHTIVLGEALDVLKENVIDQEEMVHSMLFTSLLIAVYCGCGENYNNTYYLH